MTTKRDGRKDVRIALQLYTVRLDAARDLRGVLKAVRDMGYDGVEFCGLFGHEPGEVRGWLDGLGLAAVANHVSLDALAAPEQEIEAGRALGCTFAVLGFLDEGHRHDKPGFDGAVATVRAAAAAFRAAGLALAYHNHNFEFQNTAAGNGLELLLDAVPELDAQFDAGWLGIAGQDPVAWLNRYAGRYSSVHLKDYLPGGGEGYDFCPIGMGGALDYPAIIGQALKGGARWLIVDQDDDARRPSLEAARLSAEFLRSLGL